MGKLVQQTRLKLNISPQQMMLMKMLQMPYTMLEQAVKEEVEKNPLLEPDSAYGEDAPVAEPLEPSDSQRNADDYDSDDYDAPASGNGSGLDLRENYMAADLSMADSLMGQLSMRSLTEHQSTILREMVGSLDDSGYLSRDLDLIENELAYRQGIDCDEGELEQMLKILQSLEPAGVGARNLQECMLLQINRIQPQTFETRCAKAVVEQCFDLLGQRNYEGIMERLDIDEEAVEGAMECIRHLNPKPCDAGAAEPETPTAVPDFVVSIDGGHLSVSMTGARRNRVKLSTQYTQMLDQLAAQKSPSPADKQTLEFLKEKSAAAQEFIDNLDQRQDSLLSTMKLLAAIQRKYLATGDRADLKPLTQRQMAEMVEVDDSVMSRMVNQKYVQTDFGIVPMKDFFVHTTASNAEGEDVTTAKIQKYLKEIVDAEDKQHPLTDDQIVEQMRLKGLSLARRTISKYRAQMGIPAGIRRKVTKMLVLILMMGASTLMAQQPQSYYDSLIYQQQHPETSEAPASAVKVKMQKIGRNAVAKLPAKKTAQQPVPPAEAVMAADASLPASLWYGSRFPSNRVKVLSLTMDSLPDEVNLRLLKGDEQFCFPVKNVRTSPYGWRWERPHRGVDIALNVGDPVYSAFDGVVRIACPMGAYGNLVVVRHYNGLETVYGHLSKIKVKVRQEVKAGDVLGLGGSTGRSTGPHLHFETRFQYEPFDPEWILDFGNYTLRTKKLHLDKTYFGISRPKPRQVLAYKADKSFVKEEAERKKPSELYYTVKRGDKLSDIAARYKTTVDKIKELNPDFEKMRSGLKLRVR